MTAEPQNCDGISGPGRVGPPGAVAADAGLSVLGLALDQNHVDAPAVHVDHLEAPAR